MTIHKVKINRWDGGITNNSRDPRSNTSKMVTNFDIFCDPYKLIPYRNSEDGDSSSTTSRKENFCIGKDGSGNYNLYGLGVVSGTARAEILVKALTTGASNDLDDATWATPANNASASGTTAFDLFVYYERTGLIYGAKAGTTIWAFDPTASAAFDESEQAITYTNIAQGLVHSKDDILYVPYDNKIAKNNNGTWTVAALALPSDLRINSIAEFGNFLAIGCQSTSGLGHSKVYLWNRDSSLTTLSDVIDWGHGNLKVLDTVDGVLVGISLSGGVTTRFDDRIVFRAMTGGGGGNRAVKIKELLVSGNTSQLPIYKQKEDGKLYFVMYLPSFHGAVREGLWSVSRSDPSQGFTVAHERTPNNDTSLTSPVLKGFQVVGDYVFQAYVSSSAYAVTKTNDQETYTATSIWESVINPNMNEAHRGEKKQLVSVRLRFDSLPTSTEAKLSYRFDGAAFTEIFTDDTDSDIIKEATNDVNKSNFKSGRELEFKLEGQGAAVASLEYSYKIIQTHV